MKYNTVIFDLDGTLLDTIDDLYDSADFALKKFNITGQTLELTRRFVGNGVSRLIEDLTPKGKQNPDFENILAEFKNHYAKNCTNKTRPYDDIVLLLNTLKSNNCKIAVVSNKFDSAVKNLTNLYFKGLVDLSVGESEEIRRKPFPDSVLKVIDKLGSNKKNALYIGDSEVDIETAKNAGIDIISVTWGFRSKSFLEKNGAKITVDSPLEIINYI